MAKYLRRQFAELEDCDRLFEVNNDGAEVLIHEPYGMIMDMLIVGDIYSNTKVDSNEINIIWYIPDDIIKFFRFLNDNPNDKQNKLFKISTRTRYNEFVKLKEAEHELSNSIYDVIKESLHAVDKNEGTGED